MHYFRLEPTVKRPSRQFFWSIAWKIRCRASRRRGRRIDHLLHFGDFCRRKAADLSVLMDDGFVSGEIATEGLVVSDVALDPLDVGAELTQHLIRLGGSSPELLPLKGADLGDVSLNDESTQSHGVLPRTASAPSA